MAQKWPIRLYRDTGRITSSGRLDGNHPWLTSEAEGRRGSCLDEKPCSCRLPSGADRYRGNRDGTRAIRTSRSLQIGKRFAVFFRQHTLSPSHTLDLVLPLRCRPPSSRLLGLRNMKGNLFQPIRTSRRWSIVGGDRTTRPRSFGLAPGYWGWLKTFRGRKTLCGSVCTRSGVSASLRRQTSENYGSGMCRLGWCVVLCVMTALSRLADAGTRGDIARFFAYPDSGLSKQSKTSSCSRRLAHSSRIVRLPLPTRRLLLSIRLGRLQLRRSLSRRLDLSNESLPSRVLYASGLRNTKGRPNRTPRSMMLR